MGRAGYWNNRRVDDHTISFRVLDDILKSIVILDYQNPWMKAFGADLDSYIAYFKATERESRVGIAFVPA